jgi:hypothetical protein
MILSKNQCRRTGTGLAWLRLEARGTVAIHQGLATLRSELEQMGGYGAKLLPELIGELNPHLKGWVPARCK